MHMNRYEAAQAMPCAYFEELCINGIFLPVLFLALVSFILPPDIGLAPLSAASNDNLSTLTLRLRLHALISVCHRTRHPPLAGPKLLFDFVSSL